MESHGHSPHVVRLDHIVSHYYGKGNPPRPEQLLVIPFLNRSKLILVRERK